MTAIGSESPTSATESPSCRLTAAAAPPYLNSSLSLSHTSPSPCTTHGLYPHRPHRDTLVALERSVELFIKDQAEGTGPVPAPGALVCLGCADVLPDRAAAAAHASSSSSSSSSSATNHSVFLQLDPLAVYCTGCGDYVYDEAVDRHIAVSTAFSFLRTFAFHLFIRFEIVTSLLTVCL
jgi:hypothetical protein